MTAQAPETPAADERPLSSQYRDQRIAEKIKPVAEMLARTNPPAPPASPAGQDDYRERVAEMARKQGWNPDEGEGAVEYLMRAAYETGFSDAKEQKGCK